MHQPKRKSTLKGFTLIEVMVVVFIIGIIVTLVRVAWPGPQIKARDLKRISAVNTVQTALGLYYKDQGFYPTNITAGQPLRSPDNRKTYLDEIPLNPVPRTDNNCPDSEYTYKVFNNNQSYSYSACIGDEKTKKNKLIFGTKEAIFNCGDRITDRDGFTYRTTSIGNQCWMADNLKTRTYPDGRCINDSFGATPPNCSYTSGGVEYESYNFSHRDCITPSNTRGTVASGDCNAGRTLYTVYGATRCFSLSRPCASPKPPNTFCCAGTWISDINVQGICPNGWHVPNENEFATLEQYLRDSPYSCDPNRISSIQCENAGTKLRGSSGFNAALIGRRQDDGISFAHAGINDIFITANIDAAGNTAYMRYVSSSYAGVLRQSNNISLRAWSLRCVKD